MIWFFESDQVSSPRSFDRLSQRRGGSKRQCRGADLAPFHPAARHKKVHILAHSMGSQIVVASLHQIAEEYRLLTRDANRVMWQKGLQQRQPLAVRLGNN
mmetsp:Transcript_2279/g.6812  ORF Transcript_2279/g.6812 Transcript_2279/m.6812 type:complete len:100 (-) Transcript_2279:1450-1749(-)